MTRPQNLTRRQFVSAASISAAGISASSAAATVSVSGAAAADGEQHDHAPTATGVPYNSELVESALHCVRTGRDCLEHCFESFAAGDTSLALCAKRVHELAAGCDALADMAAHNSDHLKTYARATIDVCKACETECRKHSHHAPCTTCADSCGPCIEACNKLLAS